MKVIIIMMASFAAASLIDLQEDESFCCRYAAFMEDCHDTCLEFFKTSNQTYLNILKELFSSNCPKAPDLELFWNCIDPIFKNVTDAWYGNDCCEVALDDQCRTICLESKTREEVIAGCPPDTEEALYNCAFKEQSRQTCCTKRPSASGYCRHRCVMLFRSESGPNSEDVSSLSSSCDQTMIECMRNYTKTKRQNSAQSAKCCKHASNRQCQESCTRILSSEMKEADIVNGLRKSCGEIVPHEPLWRCFLENPTPSREGGPFVTKLHCCSRASSRTCKDLCTELYGNPWAEPDKWRRFEQQCQRNSEGIELQKCLEEVTEPCTSGCKNLSFCANFNNRPTTLFRSCNAEADDLARDQYNTWLKGYIQLPSFQLPVKNVDQCEPESWKSVACLLQIKPCNSELNKAGICKSDCLLLLGKCVDKARLPGRLEIEEICEMLSPSHLQKNCIQLKTYKEPSSNWKYKSEITQPCHPSPCQDAEVCVITRRKCKGCKKYQCFPGCKLGHGSNFVVSQGSLIRVPDTSRGDGCFKSCICSTSGLLRPCTDLPCTDKPENCMLAGQLRAHGSSFNVECNFCSCIGGSVTCTKRQCHKSSKENDVSTGLTCDCPSFYEPVCNEYGHEYPNSCIATCLSQSKRSVTRGSCMDLDPCKELPCKAEERCVRTPRTCLISTGKCPQHECIPRYHKCLNLLKTAIPIQEGKAFKLHHYPNEQDILSSSYFFSSISVLSNNSGLCDARNRRYENICKLTRSKRRKLAYAEHCKSRCQNGNPVCGQDHHTYVHECMATANGVLIDHYGPCMGNRLQKFQNISSESKCADIKCPSLSRSGCKSVVTPGSCCPICGGLLRVLFSKNHLEAVQSTSWNGPVTVRDIVWLLRAQLHVSECQVYGYLTIENDIALVIVSTKSKPSILQQEICLKETERLYHLINNRNPTLTSYMVLSPLTAASLSPSVSSGIVILLPSTWIFISLLLFSINLGCHIT